MGGVASAVSDAFCSVASAVSGAVCTVVSDVGSVVCSVIQNPTTAIADIAAVATGNPELIPLINGTITYATTGCATKALEGAAISAVTQGVGAMGCFGGFCGAGEGCVGTSVCVSSAPSCFNGAQCFGCGSVSNGWYCSTPTSGACTSYASNICAPTGGVCTASSGAQVCAPSPSEGNLPSTGGACTVNAGATPSCGALPETPVCAATQVEQCAANTVTDTAPPVDTCVATATCLPESTTVADTCAAKSCLSSETCLSKDSCLASEECATMKDFCSSCESCCSGCCSCCSCDCSCGSHLKHPKLGKKHKVKTAGLGKAQNTTNGASPSSLTDASTGIAGTASALSTLGKCSTPTMCDAKNVINYSNNAGADVLTPLQEGKIVCSPLPTNTGMSNLSPQMLQAALGNNINGAVVDPTQIQDALQTSQTENIAPSTTFAGGGSAKCEDDSCGVYHPKAGCFKNPFCQAKMTPQFTNTGPEVLHGTGNQNSQHSGLTALKHIHPSIGSSMGLAAGGLPSKYHEAAPEGHKHDALDFPSGRVCHWKLKHRRERLHSRDSAGRVGWIRRHANAHGLAVQ